MQTKDNSVTDYAQQILNQVRTVVVGKDPVLLWVLAAILASSSRTTALCTASSGEVPQVKGPWLEQITAGT